MKSLSAMLLTIGICSTLLFACNVTPARDPYLQQQIDSIRLRLTTLYQPGVGDLMSTIQLHHAKLWFAGKNGNWPLAAYNASLIASNFKKIQRFHSGTFEARAAAMIDIPMDSINTSIGRKDGGSFQRSFVVLTTTCNNCHAVTHHPYNVIIIPDKPPVDNQEFVVNSTKK